MYSTQSIAFPLARTALECGRSASAVIPISMAEIMTLASCRVLKVLPEDCRLILAGGNSILLEVPEDRISKLVALVRTTIEQRPPGLTMRLNVEVRSGKTWSDCDPNRIVIKGHRRAPRPKLPRILCRYSDVALQSDSTATGSRCKL